MRTYSEQDLVMALKLRDNEAYRYLYLHYRKALFTVISQIIPDAETAGDVLQEMFVTVWKEIEKYNSGKGRLFTWLMTIARNTAINTTRSKSYKSGLKNDDLDHYVNTIDSRGGEQLNINFIGLRKQLERLRPEHKNALELAYFNGYTQQEIADHLRIPIGTVKTHLRNAILELRKQFV